jgi:Xaa-Pro aminopeptidase
MRPALGALVLAAAALAAAAADVPDSVTGVDLRVEHAQRRAALAEALPPDSLAIVAAVQGDDMALFAARQDEDYAWLTGLDDPNGVLLLEPPAKKGGPPVELLLLPVRKPAKEAWRGPRASFGEEWTARLGVAATGDLGKALETLKERLRGVKTVLLPRQGGAGEYVERLFGDVIREKGVKTADLQPVVGRLRLVKSAEELARIRRASELSAEGHRRAMASARHQMAEYEVQAILEEACRAGGCRRQAYDSIVASGPNSCTLHYGTNRRVLEEGDVVLVDAGGEYLGYACDVTRTWPVGEKFTEEQAKAYDAVLAAQVAGEKAAKPGATFKEISDACLAVLKERGIEKGWKHGPCHWVGRGVHDPNDSAEGPTALRPGVVFVIEPGAYFPAQGWGIRIEDTYAMREDGSLDCLSKDAPKDRESVEALRAASAQRSRMGMPNK